MGDATAPRKLKLVASDFHVGRGKYLPGGNLNHLEDFHHDDAFIEFLDHHAGGEFAKSEVELILNGDFFNHLQTDPADPSPEIIDEAAAVSRTREILEGHPGLFAALRRFADSSRRSVTFVLGNHDPGLLFAAVHRLLQESIGPRTRIVTGRYRFDGVLVEHGNQYFADNAYDTRRYFLTENLPSPVVNLPWGSFFVIHYLNKVKRERPYFDKIFPFKHYLRWALIHDTLFAFRSIFRIVFYFVWLRFRRDPHRRSSFVKTLQILKEVPISPKLDREAKKILLSERDTHVVVFGHTHYAVLREFAPGKFYVNTGLWSEKISLEISNPGRIVRLTYAALEYDDQGRVTPHLREWKGSHKMIEEL
ncbi:MAG TPA: metallophosphoesterase [bacterium]|nr:metallophosphoesterase [bacterium]